MAALTVHNAELKTAAVELKTLTISGKQVTLAVFRQLREEPLIAEDGTLNGVPWGIVNYHPDKCGDASEHRHVVWQHGSELRRSAIYAPGGVWIKSRWAGAFAEVAIAEGMSQYSSDRRNRWGVRIEKHLRYSVHDEARSDAIWFTYEGIGFIGEVLPPFSMAFIGRGGRDGLGERAAAIVGPHGCAADLLDMLPAEEYRAAWTALGDLPQLFIAV
jgi:hypothetical protein